MKKDTGIMRQQPARKPKKKKVSRDRKTGSKIDALTGLTRHQARFALLYALPDENGRYRTGVDCLKLAGYACGGNAETIRHDAHITRHKPQVAARIEELRKMHLAEIEDRANYGIAVQVQRIAEKIERYNDLKDLIRARAKGLPEIKRRIEDIENELANCEDEFKQVELKAALSILCGKIGIGEETGLLARDVKSVDGVAFHIFRFDKAILDAMREIENDIAKELGQITDKTEHSFDMSKLTEEEFEALGNIKSKLAAK